MAAPVETQRPAHRTSSWPVLALAMGGFAIGTTEFVTMGLLPQIADGVDVSIPTGGHVISAYALGVVVGAPVIAFLGARLPRRGLLVALMVAFAVGNAASALAIELRAAHAGARRDRLPARRLLRRGVVGRGLHGPAGAQGPRVASVMLGLSVANVVGVPAGDLARPAARLAVGVLGRPALALLTVALVLAFVPSMPRTTRTPPGGASCRRSPARRSG